MAVYHLIGRARRLAGNGIGAVVGSYAAYVGYTYLWLRKTAGVLPPEESQRLTTDAVTDVVLWGVLASAACLAWALVCAVLWVVDRVRIRRELSPR